MRVFISSSRYDREVLHMIVEALQLDGHDIFSDNLNIKSGDNWFKKINEGIKDFDAILILLSRDTMNSKFALKEIESIVLNDISKKTTRIIPIITDRSVPPSYLMNYQFVDMSRGMNYGIEKLRKVLSSGIERAPREVENIRDDQNTRNETFTKRLKESLKAGDLTLVCGAGVSIGANIPSWNELLLDLLETMIARISNDQSISLKRQDASNYRSILGSSSLV
ncbi:TIR domain-containing protein, partial [bacterium]|nr:TIR domain-containing protein [bacterium]